MKEKKKQVIVYEAADGTEFRSMKECMDYEDALNWADVQQLQDTRCEEESLEISDPIDGHPYTQLLKLSDEEYRRMYNFYEKSHKSIHRGSTVHSKCAYVLDPNGLYLHGVLHVGNIVIIRLESLMRYEQRIASIMSWIGAKRGKEK